MKTSKVLMWIGIGCGGLIILAATGGFLFYWFVISPLISSRLKMPAGLQTPAVVTGSGFLQKSLFQSDPRLGKVTDIVLGELDGQPGSEIGVAGTQGALILDKGLKVKSSVQFDARTTHAHIIDLNGDGICEFMNMNRAGWSIDASLLDHKGMTLWSYGGMPGVDDVCAGDIDGDGRLEFAVGFNGGGGVHLVDSAGRRRWKEPDGNVWHVEMADINADGKLEIVHSNAAGRITVRDGQGRILSRAKPAPYFSGFSLCRWPDRKSRQYALLAEGDAVWILGFNGKTVMRLDAPRAGSLGNASGVTVKLVPGEPEYLAVAVDYEIWKRSNLYVYDSKGTLVYQEIVPEACASIAALPLDNSDREAILLGGEGRVWQYQARGSTESK